MLNKNKVKFLVITKDKNNYNGQKVLIDVKKKVLLQSNQINNFSYLKMITKDLDKLQKDSFAHITTIDDYAYEEGSFGIVNTNSLIVIPKCLARNYNREFYSNLNSQIGKYLPVHNEYDLKDNMRKCLTIGNEKDFKQLLKFYKKQLLNKQIDVELLSEIHYCLFNKSQLIRPFDTDRRSEELMTKILLKK